MNMKLAALKEEIEMLDEMSQASPALVAARKKVADLEHARDHDEHVIFNTQLITRLTAEVAAAQKQAALAAVALQAAERAHEAAIAAACRETDAAEKADLSKNKEASEFGMHLTKQYGMPLSELRALVE